MQANLTTPVATRKTALEQRLIELGVRLEAIEDELDSHQNRDWEELATEREGDEVLEATGNAGKAVAATEPAPAAVSLSPRRGWISFPGPRFAGVVHNECPQARRPDP